MAEGEENHHNLAVTYGNEFRRSDRPYAPAVGLYAPGFPSNVGWPRERHISAATLEESFEGTSSGDEEIRQVCLHEEEVWNRGSRSTSTPYWSLRGP
jgi:hypothetical protein